MCYIFFRMMNSQQVLEIFSFICSLRKKKKDTIKDKFQKELKKLFISLFKS